MERLTAIDQESRLSQQDWDRFARLVCRSNQLLRDKEEYWKTRLKFDWLQHGDENSKFFHAWIHQQIKEKADSRPRERQGMNLDNTMVHFKNLWNLPNTRKDDEILSYIKEVVTAEQNEALTRPLEISEIDAAIASLRDGKVTGPDGFGAEFYKAFITPLRGDIFDAFKTILQKRELPNDWKRTLVTLIPKINNPTEVTDYRPIGVCNTIYKILAKVLVARWVTCIREHVNDAQHGFIPGKDIVDAHFIIQECWHTMKQKTRETHFMAKLDLDKAYDRVRWQTLKEVMQKMGYNNIWIDWINACCNNGSCRLKGGDDISETLTTTNGLRQGDPLSPFLFAIYINSLSSLIDHHMERGNIKGMNFAQIKRRDNRNLDQTQPRISHILYADDVVIMGRVEDKELDTWKVILQKFQEFSGQIVSCHKSQVYSSLDKLTLGLERHLKATFRCEVKEEGL